MRCSWLSPPEGEEEEALPLSLLRLDPGPVGVESALSEIAKLRSCGPLACHLICLLGTHPGW